MRLKFPSILLIICCMSFRPCFGLITNTIDELHPLQAKLSLNSFNRIVIENSGVKKVIAPESYFDVQIDDITHQAFVTLKEIEEEPIALSIITDGGFVQDILVSAAEIPTETILLKEPEDENISPKFSREVLKSIISSFARNTLPHGFIPVQLQKKDQRTSPYLTCKIGEIFAAEGPFERLIGYRIKNASNAKVKLKEADFAKSMDLWIYLGKADLEPREETTLIIAQYR